jgi:NTE family protein
MAGISGISPDEISRNVKTRQFAGFNYINSLRMEKFTTDPEILKLVSAIKEKGIDKKQYTDIVDGAGNQYVDLVQEGGGVLGIALCGYTYILEKAGIRFFSLAGTSAGAINTIMMAGTGRIGEPVSEIILDLLSKKNLSDFVDGNTRIKKLFQRYVSNKPYLKFYILINSFLIWRTLKKLLGFNPGNSFEQWLTETLSGYSINTLNDLIKLREQVPQLFDRSDGYKEISRSPEIQIIAADITTRSKIIFPEMADLYWDDPGSVSPAKFVRASMSIPFFFCPFEIKNIPNAGKIEDHKLPKHMTVWRNHTGYYGKIPDLVRFVDGGLLSNFPINAFHIVNRVPKKPTFGVRLSTWRGSYSKTDEIGGMTGAMVGTMRQLHDYDFIRKNPDYNNLICYINADDKYNWLDFQMPPDKQVRLFVLGATKAFSFLENFDWELYKNIRAERLL